ncbi:MAG TPA: divergent polysaccharide deacetylase family protein [Ferrovibrio sp.]|uniref:divergent polysaccharide deacetylase family protein n=1 Tax=Ferrovibrio sp. TaxID=1917215 RepID=UPI002ED225DD
MSDPDNTPTLKLRPRNTAQRAATAQTAANAYGATQTQVTPAAPVSTQAAAPSPKLPRRGVIAANWPLMAAAAALLAGGIAMGIAVGSATPTPVAAVATVTPLAPQPETTVKPHDAAPFGTGGQAKAWPLAPASDQRPALAPPPPPPNPIPVEQEQAAQKPEDAAPPPPAAEPAPAQPTETATGHPDAPPVQVAAAPVPPKSLAPSDAGPQAWRARAVPPPAGSKPPFVAILIDDAGLNHKATARALALPGPITLSFMTYANDLAAQTRAARSAGHELMLHLPMEPLDLKHNDPGPNALLVKLDASEIKRRLNWGLDRFEGYVGVNNHMGSRFTRDHERMTEVMAALRNRQVFWLDSLSGPGSVAAEEARKAGLDTVERDLFLDDPRSPGIAYELSAMERIARARGDVIAIGHPHPSTLAALEKWTATAKERGFSLVPVSTVLLRREQMER